ncbi:hypothetical protein SERLA73DRAFT_187512 [Serpula lacrymans var. lacrymans S7.3]|uniref:NADAR domain-containing protein n=2 Tax=Serpula lacrymans var. lacrymans TaxID=341189 RepID=F8Q9D0_SERL3|nr:uncharacterized protein SERLADRAFT_477153 [Serpula lacrymans var. lacrymans S7.9]EGN95185.1 hypothetical protein SERLA73DRAFT_187512 [Serpula lacrymans var. lacrymans S7.3]EGO20714.1 hypothetical protein SERLADRAFT_477153 [Serpula lacrymans var. lacrymans S7.9]
MQLFPNFVTRPPVDDAMEVDDRISPSASYPSSDSHDYSPSVKRILFYDRNDPYYGFTNFSAHTVNYKGKLYPTSEHLFQSFKFQGHRPDLAEHLRTFSTRPSDVFKEARRFQADVRPDWLQVNVEKMDETLYHKFTQHNDLLAELMGTGNAELVEDSAKDAFWGIGADGRGRNELGKSLMRLRKRLRAESGGAGQPSVYGAFKTMMATALSPSTKNQVPTHRATPTNTALCEYCHQRPKYQNHPYCGKTCAKQAKATAQTPNLCIQCHKRPKHGNHDYCGRTCATYAKQAKMTVQIPSMCVQCHKRPKHGNHDYCGRTCAQIAKNRLAAFGPPGTSIPSTPSSLLSPDSLRRKSSESIDYSPNKRAKPDIISPAHSKRDSAPVIFNPSPLPRAPAPVSTPSDDKRNIVYTTEPSTRTVRSDVVSFPRIKISPAASPSLRSPAVVIRIPSSRTNISSSGAVSSDDEDAYYSCPDEDAPTSPGKYIGFRR